MILLTKKTHHQQQKENNYFFAFEMSVCGVKARVVTLNDLFQIGFWIFYSQADIDCDLVKTLETCFKMQDAQI